MGISSNLKIIGYLGTGSACPGGDTDFYSLTLAPAMAGAGHVYIDCASEPQFITLNVYNASQTLVSSASTASFPVSYSAAVSFSSGVTYYIKVSNGVGPYTVEVTNP